MSFKPSLRDLLALTKSPTTLTLTLLPLFLALYRLSPSLPIPFITRTPKRPRKIPATQERVLILGGTSGIGRSVARQYAERGARVCVVGRRGELLQEVVTECRDARVARGFLPVLEEEGGDVFGVRADFADVDDMVRVRTAIQEAWGGLDTHIVAAGVSALQPLMEVAGVEVSSSSDTITPITESTAEGIQHTTDVALAAIRGNYIGPLIAAVTFVPMLSNTSPSPSMLLLNSLASLIPAPTRTLYASTKSASLLLFQALSIEHPQIAFTFFLPSTVEGDFRASAVDSGPVREKDPNRHGLKREDVARRCVEAVDGGEKSVFMPGVMRYAHLMYWVVPRFVERMARRKYNFKTQ